MPKIIDEKIENFTRELLLIEREWIEILKLKKQ